MSDYIPPEAWIEIFLRLPAKSVAELRYVCKSWYFLITNPNFISMYTRYSIKNQNDNNNPRLIMIRSYSKTEGKWVFTLHRDDETFGDKYHKQLELPSQINFIYYWNIVGTCNGLSCFETNVKKLSKSLILWNSSIGVSMTILIEQISVDTGIYGFGFDSKSNDYKVVRIEYQMKNWSKISMEIKIFALSKGYWRSIFAKAPPPFIIVEQRSKAFVNEAVHWIAYYKEIGDGGRKWVVAAFNMGDELFKELKMPDGLMQEVVGLRSKNEWCIGVFGQLLCLTRYSTQCEKSLFYDCCCIWVMKEYGVAESWTKHIKIDLKLGIQKGITLRRNGEILLVTRHNFELVSYDPTSRRINGLGIYCNSDPFYAVDYMECVALMNGKTGNLGQSSYQTMQERNMGCFKKSKKGAGCMAE